MPVTNTTTALCVESALEFWNTAEAPSQDDIRRLFTALVERDATTLIWMAQQGHTTSEFPTEAFAGWQSNYGCWTGPVRFDAAARVASWLGEHNVGVVVESSGMGLEVRLRYTNRDNGYWWPNAATRDGAVKELHRVL